MVDNKTLVREIHDRLNRGQMGVVDELYAANYVGHVGSRQSDLAEYKAYLARHRTAFPDWRTTIVDLMADGDRVIARISECGTHKGVWRHHAMGDLEATHRTVESARIIIRKFRNEQVEESWISADHLHLLMQVGAFHQAAAKH